MIDVRDLIARYSPEEHAARADAYFEGIGDNWLLRRKPWMNAMEAQGITRALSLILDNLDLRPGLRLLDFGAGTCWLSIIFAYLGCDVIATDVSARALEQGARIKAEDPIARDLPIAFARTDAKGIPLPDEDVDRIVCMDSFHHVADQAGTLREFYRILRPGGRIAFAEPGPEHSRSPQSQYEMTHHDVIENDIVIEDLDRFAGEIGFLPMEVAFYTPAANLLDVASFNRRISGQFSPGEAEAVLGAIGASLVTRTFFLRKPGSEATDSRSARGLAGNLTSTIDYGADGTVVTFTARNTGTAKWLPSGETIGSVGLGVRLVGPNGDIVNPNYARIPVSADGVNPGDDVSATFSLPVPPPEHQFSLDLVSEHVTWFEMLPREATHFEELVRPIAERTPPLLKARIRNVARRFLGR